MEWQKSKILAREEISVVKELCRAVREGMEESCPFHGPERRHISAQPAHYLGKRKHGYISHMKAECALWQYNCLNRFDTAASSRKQMRLSALGADIRRGDEPGDMSMVCRQSVIDWQERVMAANLA